MRTFHKTQKRNSGRKRVISLLVVFLIIFEFFFAPLRSFVFGTTDQLVGATLESQGLLHQIVNAVTRSKKDLLDEIEKKDEVIMNLTFENQRTELLVRENQSLRNLLGFQEVESGSQEKRFFARVVRRPGPLQADQMITYAKNANRLLLGQVVFYGPYRLGVVSQVEGSFITVDLYSANESVTGLFKGEPVSLMSQGEMLFSGQLPKSIEVEEGDIMVLEEYPDTPFVEVTNITTEESDPFWTFFARLPVSFSDIEYVTIE